MTVNGVGSYGTFAVSGSSGRNVKSGQSVRFNFQAAGEKADNLLAGMKELDTGKRSSDRSILEDSGCFDSSYWSENMKKAAETADSEQSVTDLREEYARLLKESKYVIICTLPLKKTCRPSGGTFYFFFLVRNPSGNSFDHGKSRFRSSGFGKGPILRSSSNT